MKNPKGYGSVVKLSGKRRKPFWIRKTAGWNEKGQPIYKTIGYTATREEGNILLAEYNKNPWNVDTAKLTLKELYDLWVEKRAPKLGEKNRKGLFAVYQHIKKYADEPYREIRAYQMQESIDNCGYGGSTQSKVKNLWRHLDKFALELDVISKMYSSLLTSEPIPETTRTPFTRDEIIRLWNVYADVQSGKVDDPVICEWVDTILIFIYSGFRFKELLTMKTADVDLKQMTFKGGIKTKAGRNRIVPIHSRIQSLVKARYDPECEYFIHQKDGHVVYGTTYRGYWLKMMKFFDMNKIPHECRHTFETFLDSAGANRKCIDLMMGHASQDVGNRVYNHKTIEELRTAIELFIVN